MSVVALHSIHRVQRGDGAIDQLARGDVAEVARGEVREQRQADVGGRRPVGQALHRVLLQIVGRQEVVVRGDEGVEEGPGAAGECTQVRRLRSIERGLPALERLVDPPDDARRYEPKGEHRQRSGQCVGAEGGKADHGDERERRRHPHAAGGVREVGRRGAAASARGVRRRLPLEQPALRQPQPPCGAGDRIEADERLVGQAGQRERGLAQAALRRRDDRGEMLGHAQVVGLARKVAEQTEQRRQEEHGEARERPQPRRLQDGPAEHEGERQRARRQTAPKVVQDLPARQTRQWIAHRDPAALHRVGRIGLAQAQPRQQPAGDLPIASHPAVAALHVGVVARRRLLDQFDVA